MRLLIRLFYLLVALGLCFALAAAFVAFGGGAQQQRLLFAATLLPILLAVAAVCAFKIPLRVGKNSSGHSLRNLHAWLGGCLAVLMFAINFSGVVALFENEIHIWESPVSRIELKPPFIQIDPYLRALSQRIAQYQPQGYLYVSRPRAEQPYFVVAAQIPGKNARATGTFETRDPHTGELLQQDVSALSSWLRTLHSDLSFRKKAGQIVYARTLLGIFGVFLVAIVLAGILMHPNLFRSLFTWRTAGSRINLWRDTHMSLGAWVMIFALMIAATGASIALIRPLIPIVSSLSGGEVRSARDLVAGEILPAGKAAQMMNADQLFARATEYLNGNTPITMRIINWNDANARALFVWQPTDKITKTAQLELDAISGELIQIKNSEVGGYAGRLDSAMPALHYATFANSTLGSLGLRSLYAILGLGLSMMSVSGLLYWLQKQRLKTDNTSTLSMLDRIGRLTHGVCVGMFTATAMAFFGYRLWPSLSVGDLYFSVWGLSIAAMLILNISVARLTGLLLLLSASALVATAGVDTLAMLQNHNAFHWSALGVNTVLLICAAFSIGYGLRQLCRVSKS